MTGLIESFVNDAVLHSDEMAVVGVHVLLGRPAELAVVDDVVTAVLRTEGVLGNDVPVHIIATDTKTDVTDDEVLRTSAVNLVMRNDDTHARRRLTGNRVVLAVNTQVFDQSYLA